MDTFTVAGYSVEWGGGALARDENRSGDAAGF